MRIMDKFNCQYCGKEVIFKTDNDYVDINKYDVDCACSDCYNGISVPIMEYESTIENEWYEMQGSYLG
ncbi:hypothetical protein [Clostridium tertium]|jgi:transcription elongation factor Elf1|uniref:hypothetical protein n=1 Tax=Clostridium tertium TaxID=1559 RepID=UPI00374E5C56|nr:hypothetical protein [Clostridium sp.]